MVQRRACCGSCVATTSPHSDREEAETAMASHKQRNCFAKLQKLVQVDDLPDAGLTNVAIPHAPIAHSTKPTPATAIPTSA